MGVVEAGGLGANALVEALVDGDAVGAECQALVDLAERDGGVAETAEALGEVGLEEHVLIVERGEAQRDGVGRLVNGRAPAASPWARRMSPTLFWLISRSRSRHVARVEGGEAGVEAQGVLVVAEGTGEILLEALHVAEGRIANEQVALRAGAGRVRRGELLAQRERLLARGARVGEVPRELEASCRACSRARPCRGGRRSGSSGRWAERRSVMAMAER